LIQSQHDYADALCTSVDAQLIEAEAENADLRAQLAAAVAAADIAELPTSHGQLLHVPVQSSCGSK
jgi:hypothetical protein